MRTVARVLLCKMSELNKNLESVNGNSLAPFGMHSQDFRQAAHEMVDYIIGYHSSLAERQTFPDVKPGFMRPLVGKSAPEAAEEWPKVFADLEEVIMKGMTHWHSSGFVALFPTGCSYPSLLADMLSDAVGCIGFTWASSPSCTELETVMMDWLAKALGLPECYLHEAEGPGGGVIQGTASEATLVTLLSARSKAIREQLTKDPSQSVHDITKRLVAYTSECSHSSVERAGKIALVTTRLLEVDEGASLRGATLARAIEEDKKKGKIPIYVCATIGTTSCCTFDNLLEIAPICNKENIWLHVDAAYAGSALLCSELRHIANGLEFADSFNFNPHKWMMVNFDCSALWFKDSTQAINAMNMDPLYLRHEEMDSAIDYMHWQIPLGRRFRSIKLWFVLRIIGLEGLRSNVRRGVTLAKYLEEHVRKDERFEVVFPVTLGLVCLRLNARHWKIEKANSVNRKLHDAIHADRRFYITPSCVGEKYFIRISTGSLNCTYAKVDECWSVLQEMADKLMKLE